MIRDIYNRPRKLEHWKNRAKNEIAFSDLDYSIIHIIENIEDIESSMLWIGEIYHSFAFFA